MKSSEAKLVVSHSLQALPESSKLLLQETQNPFMDYVWFNVFCEHVAPRLGQQLWLSLVQGQETLAILPLLDCSEGRLKVLKSMSNYYSSYFDLIAREDHKEEHLSQLISKAKALFRDYDIIRLAPLQPSATNAIKSAFSSFGYLTHAYHHTDNWRHLNIVDFESYWESRGSRLKSTVKRKGKKVAQLEHNFQVISEEITAAQIDDYNEIYFKSWKQEEPFPNFIPTLLHKTGDAKTLRLGILYIEGKPVASQIWLTFAGVAYIYKLAYDPDFQQLSVGSLLSHHLFKHAIEVDGVSAIDYLTGNDGYKAEWMEHCRPLSGLEIAVPYRPRGLAIVMISIVKHNIKVCLNWLKNIKPG